MKIKLRRLVESASSLGHLSKQPCKAKIAFCLAKNIRLIQAELNAYEDARISLCKRYGKLNKETNSYEFEPEERRHFQAEFEDLLEIEVDIEVTRLKSSDLINLTLSAAELLVLDWLIEY